MSLVTDMEGGETIETGTIGNEGERANGRLLPAAARQVWKAAGEVVDEQAGGLGQRASVASSGISGAAAG